MASCVQISASSYEALSSDGPSHVLYFLNIFMKDRRKVLLFILSTVDFEKTLFSDNLTTELLDLTKNYLEKD